MKADGFGGLRQRPHRGAVLVGVGEVAQPRDAHRHAIKFRDHREARRATIGLIMLLDEGIGVQEATPTGLRRCASRASASASETESSTPASGRRMARRRGEGNFAMRVRCRDVLQAIAKLRRALDDLLEGIARERVEFGLGARDDGRRSRGAVHQAQLAEEFARADRTNDVLGAVVALNRLQHPFANDVKGVGGLTLADHDRARWDASFLELLHHLAQEGSRNRRHRSELTEEVASAEILKKPLQRDAHMRMLPRGNPGSRRGPVAAGPNPRPHAPLRFAARRSAGRCRRNGRRA